MRKLLLAGLAASLALALSSPAFASLEGCEALTPSPTITGAPERTITARDLLGLRDIGPTAVMFLSGSPLGISPDGRRLAFQLRQANPDTNYFCLAMFVMDLEPGARPRLIDQGGELLRVIFARGPLAGYPSGEAQLIVPRWSPDGSAVAFLKAMGGARQVWVAQADGSGSRAVTNSTTDIEDFSWSADGHDIVASTRPALAAARAAIAHEGLSGWRYDDRWSPIASNHPWPAEPLEFDYRTYNLATGSVRAASPSDRRRLDPDREALPRSGTVPPALLGAKRAWIVPVDPNLTYPVDAIHVSLGDKGNIPCKAAPCRGKFAGLWWDRNGKRLIFLRHEGWASGELGLYIWHPGYGSPRRTLETSDLLLGCQSILDRLVCMHEASTTPRKIVSIDPATGQMQTIFEPNPDFRQLKLGQVERLHWTNNRGLPIFGDLVIPPGYHGERQLPLVLVQYETRGFLRGGTGDEYPIQALAARGIAVLSLQRPKNVSSLSPSHDRSEKVRLDYGQWSDKRSVLSAIESGLSILERRGLIDQTRIGITGLSDGSTTAQFSLLNSTLFRAASLSTCCEDPKTLFPLMGFYGDRYLTSYLYPDYTSPDTSFWQPYSIARNADRFTTPLLLQLADDEYLASLETVTSLVEKKRPVDSYVFAGEYHTKWQPAHRLAVYTRNLDWFDFWLNDREDPDPSKRAQFDRWRAWRAKTSAMDSQHTP